MTQKERTAHWSAIVERQAASGMSGIAWCRANHINPASTHSDVFRQSNPLIIFFQRTPTVPFEYTSTAYRI